MRECNSNVHPPSPQSSRKRLPPGAAGQRRIRVGTALVVGLFASACNADTVPYCETSRDASAPSARSPLGFSVAEAFETAVPTAMTVTWAEPPDWLSLNQSGTTTAVMKVHYEGSDVAFIRGERYNAELEDSDYCPSYLETKVTLTLASEDGALNEEFEAEARLFGLDQLEFKGVLDAGELRGTLAVSRGTVLQPVLRLKDGTPEGGIRAAREVPRGQGSALRLTSIASFGGIDDNP